MLPRRHHCSCISGPGPGRGRARPGPGSSHGVEVFFFHNLAVLDREQSGFVHGEALAGHGSGLGRDLVGEAHDEAVVMRPWARAFGLVNLVVGYPPVALALDRGQAFAAPVLAGRAARLDGDDVGAVEGVVRLRALALLAQGDEFLADFYGVLHALPLGDGWGWMAVFRPTVS